MAAGPTISQQKIIAAAKHDPNMIEVLQQLAAATTQQQSVTGTTPKAGTTAGQPNPAAAVPAQARGSVSILNKSYIVQLVNPGGTSPISQLQAQQAAGGATPLTALQPVTPIYHQIRASTSAAFNVNSNTQVFGGNTGSTQTYWTLTGLGSGTFYIQFRSSFDGINWNKWKNANGGTALGGLINEVTTENPGNSEWALFTLPSGLIMGIGAGLMADQEVFDLAEEVYSSGMVAIAGPNGLSSVGSSAFGVTLCDVDLQTPAVPPPGIPDLPVEIRMQYGEHSTSGTWPGNASVFAIAFDPTNENVTLYEEPGGSTVWAVFRLPGGARIAIGQGKNTHGDTLWTPPALTWFNWVRSMSISSFTDATDTGATPHGYYSNKIAAGVLSAEYNDESTTWPTKANWMAIAWEQGTDVQTVAGFPWLKIQLQGGHAVMIGAGQQATPTTAVTLPAGFNEEDSLSICTPGGFVPAGHHIMGVNQCGLEFLTPTLEYIDDSGNTWTGICNWLMAIWK